MKQTFEIGSMIKIDQEQIKRCGHNWTHTNEVYIISKIIKISSDGYNVVELNKNLPNSNKLINTFYIRLLTLKEYRKQKLEKLNENSGF